MKHVMLFESFLNESKSNASEIISSFTKAWSDSEFSAVTDNNGDFIMLGVECDPDFSDFLSFSNMISGKNVVRMDPDDDGYEKWYYKKYDEFEETMSYETAIEEFLKRHRVRFELDIFGFRYESKPGKLKNAEGDRTLKGYLILIGGGASNTEFGFMMVGKFTDDELTQDDKNAMLKMFKDNWVFTYEDAEEAEEILGLAGKAQVKKNKHISSAEDIQKRWDKRRESKA